MLINPHSLELIDGGGEGRKLVQRQIGPFEVMEKINEQVYRLRIPDSYRFSPVINREHLTKYKESPAEWGEREHLDDPRDRLATPSIEYEVEAILGHRKRKRKIEYLVRWKDYGAEEDSWQSARDLQNAPCLLRAYRSLHQL